MMAQAAAIPIIAILCIFGIPIVAIICGTILVLKKRKPAEAPGHTEMMQEIHQSLTRMEERIEALETILFDRNIKGK